MKCSIFAQHFFPFQNTLKLCSKYQYKRYSTSSLSLCSENNISDSQNKVEFLFTPDILQNIKQRLQQIPRHRISAPHRAAVFVPFCNVGGRGSLLFTKRSEKLAMHAGQVSFPGGLAHPEDGDNVIQTAIRETEEEIGLERNYITILGTFHDATTTVRKELAISSVIGFIGNVQSIEEFHLTPNPSEIDIAFTVAVSDLLDQNPARLGRTIQSFGPRINIPRWERVYQTPTGEWLPLWGMSAYLTHLVLEQLIRPLSVNVPNKEQRN